MIIEANYHGGDILVNGEHAWSIDLIKPEDVVTIVLPDEQASSKIDACDDPIDILYEDQDYLILNKPAGVATVPAHNVTKSDSLVNRVKNYYIQNGYADQVTHVATRLDKYTSGIVIFPKHRFAHTILDKQLKSRQVVKYYDAVTQGKIEISHGLIDAPIQRDPDSFVKRQVGAEGKVAQTEYWLGESNENNSLVKVLLHTGRTHQIRVHFAFIGHALLGDQMYGNRSTLIQRQALHCREIRFYSPFKGSDIHIVCPLPSDMKKLIE